MEFYKKQQVEACAKLASMLSLGAGFDPWEMFPCLYGTYSSAFDDLAIEVLEHIRDHTSDSDNLAAEMFREMLCTTGLCNYGTSPRVCFAVEEFEPLLPTLIDMWRDYRDITWQL